MLDVLLFAAGVAHAAVNPQTQRDAVPPSAELLEFIADWTEPEARQILDRQHAEAPLPSLAPARQTAKTAKTAEAHHEH
jgi:hypothetical protein